MSILQKGAAAPDFTLSDQNGQTVTLSELRGKTVLLSWHHAQIACIRRSGSLKAIKLTDSQKQNLLEEVLMKNAGVSWEAGKGWQKVSEDKTLRLPRSHE